MNHSRSVLDCVSRLPGRWDTVNCMLVNVVSALLALCFQGFLTFCECVLGELHRRQHLPRLKGKHGRVIPDDML